MERISLTFRTIYSCFIRWREKGNSHIWKFWFQFVGSVICVLSPRFASQTIATIYRTWLWNTRAECPVCNDAVSCIKVLHFSRINDKRSWIWTFARNIIHQRKRQENNKSKVPRCVVNGAQFSKNVSTNFRVGGGSVIVNVITMIFVRSDYDNFKWYTHCVEQW